MLDGTGNGHGRGLSQWGAYGYAVDHGWDWQQILGHYYGGTISGTTRANQRIDVRLTDYDGMGDVGVISHGSGVRWNGQTAPAMRADETTAGVFDIYKANTVACPSSTSLTVPDGPVVQQSGYNADAERVQRFLRTFHDTSIAVDGYFGPQTAGVLADWQADRGITVNGIRWNTDDAVAARAQIAASGNSVTWTKIGTHTQSIGSPVRFTAADGDATGTDRGDVLGVCSSGGAITHYRGAIEVVHTSGGNRVVNDVLAENYVRGVIPKEISASWAYAGGGAGENAVMAQAVAARSYGLAAEPQLLLQRHVDPVRDDVRHHVVPGVRRCGDAWFAQRRGDQRRTRRDRRRRARDRERGPQVACRASAGRHRSCRRSSPRRTVRARPAARSPW